MIELSVNKVLTQTQEATFSAMCTFDEAYRLLEENQDSGSDKNSGEMMEMSTKERVDEIMEGAIWRYPLVHLLNL